jgi:preprotein translocase SecE subunit
MKHWTIVLLVVLLTFSLFAIPAFAHDGHDHTTQEVVTDEHGHDASVHASEGLSTGEMIGLIISGVVLLVLVVLGIKFREKVAKFFRVYKSESKKIVWLPWNQTLKSTYVVLVVMVICAVVICALDIGLNTGFRAFIDLFGATTAA